MPRCSAAFIGGGAGSREGGAVAGGKGELNAAIKARVTGMFRGVMGGRGGGATAGDTGGNGRIKEIYCPFD